MTAPDMNELIRRIAEEVLGRLEAEGAAPGALILAERNDRTAEQVRSCLGEETVCHFLGDEPANSEPERFILPVLSCSSMAALAAGGANETVSDRVLQLLLEGKRVEVLEYEFHSHAQTAPHALYSLYENHARTLAEFGLVPFEACRPESTCCRELLVTEDVVARFAGAAELRVPRTAVVTPLAVDAARNHEMTIHKCL